MLRKKCAFCGRLILVTRTKRSVKILASCVCTYDAKAGR